MINSTIYLLAILLYITLAVDNDADGINGGTEDVKEMENNTTGQDESQRWINIVLIVIGGVLLVFTVVILYICYKQRAESVENKKQIKNAMKMKVMVEQEVEASVNDIDEANEANEGIEDISPTITISTLEQERKETIASAETAATIVIRKETNASADGNTPDIQCSTDIVIR